MTMTNIRLVETWIGCDNCGAAQFKKGEREFKEFEPDGWTEKNDMHYCKKCSEEEDEPPSQDEIREDLALNIDF